MDKYRFIDHTGDLGVEIFGKNLAGLFRHSGEAFTEIITDREKIEARDYRYIDLQAGQLEELMIRWLNELNFLFETKGLLFAVFDIHSIDDCHIKAEVQGEPYDETRHSIKTTVKSATYHQLEVIEEDDIWRARVIFDL